MPGAVATGCGVTCTGWGAACTGVDVVIGRVAFGAEFNGAPTSMSQRWPIWPWGGFMATLPPDESVEVAAVPKFMGCGVNPSLPVALCLSAEQAMPTTAVATTKN